MDSLVTNKSTSNPFPSYRISLHSFGRSWQSFVATVAKWHLPKARCFETAFGLVSLIDL